MSKGVFKTMRRRDFDFSTSHRLFVAQSALCALAHTPTLYTADKIERVYEFGDGAIVKYEWQSTPDGRTSTVERYNHQFSGVSTEKIA